jgi:flavin-dependent dehydrogenase
VFARGLRARTVTGEIVGVRSVGNDGNATLARERHEPRPELRLAEVAAVGRIGRIARIVQFVGLDLDDREPNRRGNLSRARPLTVGIRRAAANDREDTVGPERRDRRGGEVRGVDTTAVADGNRARRAQPVGEPSLFRGGRMIGGRVHHAQKRNGDGGIRACNARGLRPSARLGRRDRRRGCSDARPRVTDSIVDVAIIGAGPAGSAAARLLAAWGHSVVVMGRPPRHPPLAESLPPSCTKLFEHIGVREAMDAANFVRATGNTVQWAGRELRVEPFDVGLLGYQVARNDLDALLANEARSMGAVVHEDATVRDVIRESDNWRVSFDRSSGPDECRALWVLDASGRSGVLARRGWRRADGGSRTIAMAAIWESSSGWPMDEPSHTLVESYDGGWAWSVPVTSRRRFVTVMIDPGLTTVAGRAELAGSYHAELEKTTAVRALAQRATPVGDVWGCDASSYHSEQVSGDHALLLGDAASFVDPLSSFGVKKALASAWLGSVAVHTSLVDARCGNAAVELFAERETSMHVHLQRASALLSLDAADAHEGGFWAGRSDATEPVPGELDFATLRSDVRVLAAFASIREQQSLHLRPSDSLTITERATVRGNRVVLLEHLVTPEMSRGVRYCRNVDLVVLARLAPGCGQVPDLFDAYNRAAPPAPLPDFLGALSTLIGLEMLTFA